MGPPGVRAWKRVENVKSFLKSAFSAVMSDRVHRKFRKCNLRLKSTISAAIGRCACDGRDGRRADFDCLHDFVAPLHSLYEIGPTFSVTQKGVEFLKKAVGRRLVLEEQVVATGESYEPCSIDPGC
jgi:hypothetical protein